jgi:hypothetical protein
MVCARRSQQPKVLQVGELPTYDPDQYRVANLSQQNHGFSQEFDPFARTSQEERAMPSYDVGDTMLSNPARLVSDGLQQMKLPAVEFLNTEARQTDSTFIMPNSLSTAVLVNTLPHPSIAPPVPVLQPVAPPGAKVPHRNSRGNRRGPMDEMRQLVRILVKLFPRSVFQAVT